VSVQVGSNPDQGHVVLQLGCEVVNNISLILMNRNLLGRGGVLDCGITHGLSFGLGAFSKNQDA
jgi:hypothetical protein